MSVPKRIQLSRKKGWRIPPNTFVVSRPSKWGNPFPFSAVIEKFCGDKNLARAEVVRSFKRMVKDGKTPPFVPSVIRAELRGKNLACWCPLNGPCHADVLLEIANS